MKQYQELKVYQLIFAFFMFLGTVTSVHAYTEVRLFFSTGQLQIVGGGIEIPEEACGMRVRSSEIGAFLWYEAHPEGGGLGHLISHLPSGDVDDVTGYVQGVDFAVSFTAPLNPHCDDEVVFERSNVSNWIPTINELVWNAGFNLDVNNAPAQYWQGGNLYRPGALVLQVFPSAFGVNSSGVMWLNQSLQPIPKPEDVDFPDLPEDVEVTMCTMYPEFCEEVANTITFELKCGGLGGPDCSDVIDVASKTLEIKQSFDKDLLNLHTVLHRKDRSSFEEYLKLMILKTELVKNSLRENDTQYQYLIIQSDLYSKANSNQSDLLKSAIRAAHLKTELCAQSLAELKVGSELPESCLELSSRLTDITKGFYNAKSDSESIK